MRGKVVKGLRRMTGELNWMEVRKERKRWWKNLTHLQKKYWVLP